MRTRLYLGGKFCGQYGHTVDVREAGSLWQVSPSPVNPVLHVQAKERYLSAHVAFPSQGLESQSLASEIHKAFAVRNLLRQLLLKLLCGQSARPVKMLNSMLTFASSSHRAHKCVLNYALGSTLPGCKFCLSGPTI